MNVELGLDALAAYRLTRLVSADVITRPLRVRVYRHAYGALEHAPRDYYDGDDHPSRPPMSEDEWEQLAFNDQDAPKLVELVHCRWCVGVYAGFGVLVARRLAPRWWDPIARALSLAAAAALIAGLEKD